MPAARARTLIALAEAMAGGELELDAGSDRAETRQRLLAIARHRPVDRRLPVDAGDRRPGRLPGHRPRGSGRSVAALASARLDRGGFAGPIGGFAVAQLPDPSPVGFGALSHADANFQNTPTNKGHLMFHSYYDSPIGPLLLTGDGTALTGLYLAEHVRIATPLGTRDDSAFAEPVRQLEEYFAGDRRAFQLPIAPAGTPFQLRVWQLLQGIGYGERRSYGELAAELGNPNAARAVGLANGRNPISIIVPCHRVVGSKGALTGYAGGLTNKQWLLEFETRVLAGDPPVGADRAPALAAAISCWSPCCTAGTWCCRCRSRC